MNKPIDAKNVSLKQRRILFDTNIWLILNGYSNQAKYRTEAYSEAHKRLLQNDNTIVVNDYILGEFCNRSCKIEYETHRNAANDVNFPAFKRYRNTNNFLSVMESVRDTCLNIIEDCEFLAVSGGHYKITDILGRFCDGELDFSDLIMTDYCKSEKFVLMTDDFDFADCGIEIITANRKLLKS
jgi:predicted nucleic acid-binding protein